MNDTEIKVTKGYLRAIRSARTQAGNVLKAMETAENRWGKKTWMASARERSEMVIERVDKLEIELMRKLTS